MNLLDKLFNFVYKKPLIENVEKDSELYDLVKAKMDNFEKNTTQQNIESLIHVVKHLLVETQILKETIKNQNEVLNTFILTNQRLVGVLDTIIASADQMEEEENAEDEEYIEETDENEENIAETATERSKRNSDRKFGIN